MNRVVYLMLFFLCCFCFLTCKTRFFVDKDNIEALSAVDSNQGYGPTLVEQCFDSKSPFASKDPFVPTQFFESQDGGNWYLHESTVKTLIRANLIFPQTSGVIAIFLADHMIYDPNVSFTVSVKKSIALYDKDLQQIATAMTKVHQANGIPIMSDRFPSIDQYTLIDDARILRLLSHFITSTEFMVLQFFNALQSALRYKKNPALYVRDESNLENVCKFVRTLSLVKSAFSEESLKKIAAEWRKQVVKRLRNDSDIAVIYAKLEPALRSFVLKNNGDQRHFDLLWHYFLTK